MAVDLKRFLERPSQALSEPFGVLTALRDGLQHDELVAAEARDHVSGADDGTEPERDFLEELVADRVTERVIDGFEPVEVDQVDRDVILAFVHSREHGVDPLAELRPVGEAREFVELGEMRDALLRALAFGHVFKDDDGAAVGLHSARHCDGAVAVRRGLKLVELILPKAAGQLANDLLHALGFVIAGADAVPDQLRHPHADVDRRTLQMKQFDEPLVPDLQAVLLVEHAQAVRHVVEGDVEAVCLLLKARRQRGFLARHGQRLDDDVANRERDVDHRVNEQQPHEAENFVYPGGVNQQRNHHRQHDESELTDGDDRASGIASCNRGGIAGRGGDDRHLQGRVRGLHERQPAQQAEQAGESPGAGFVDALPPFDRGLVRRLLVAPVEHGRDDAQHADREDRG